MGGRELDSSGSGWGQEDCSEPEGSIKCEKLPDQLWNHQLLRKYSAP
jgi:hypothetical protein